MNSKMDIQKHVSRGHEASDFFPSLFSFSFFYLDFFILLVYFIMSTFNYILKVSLQVIKSTLWNNKNYV
jgi:hypothetical protein